MKYFDLHCDTLSRCDEKNCGINRNDCAVDTARLSKFDECYQVYAAFMPDGLSPKGALERFNRQYSIYKFSDFQGTGHILSVENAALLDHSLYRLGYLRECSAAMLSLTWNGENCLAGGADTDSGLTEFGRAVVSECERLGIIIDLSHLCDKSLYEVLGRITKPPVASHSNARSVCSHRRNLPDDALKEIFGAGGLVGINLYRDFLRDDKKADENSVLKHIDKMLSLGGENSVALGTDFDGADTCHGLKNVSDMHKLYSLISDKFNKKTADKIFYENAKNFFDKTPFLL